MQLHHLWHRKQIDLQIQSTKPKENNTLRPAKISWIPVTASVLGAPKKIRGAHSENYKIRGGILVQSQGFAPLNPTGLYKAIASRGLYMPGSIICIYTLFLFQALKMVAPPWNMVSFSNFPKIVAPTTNPIYWIPYIYIYITIKGCIFKAKTTYHTLSGNWGYIFEKKKKNLLNLVILPPLLFVSQASLPSMVPLQPPRPFA